MAESQNSTPATDEHNCVRDIVFDYGGRSNQPGGLRQPPATHRHDARTEPRRVTAGLFAHLSLADRLVALA